MIAAAITRPGQFDSALIAWGAALGVVVLTWVTLHGRTIVGPIMIYGYIAIGVAAALFYRPSGSDYYGANPGIAFLAAETPGYRYLTLFVVTAASIWCAFFLLAPRSTKSSAANSVAGLGLNATPILALPSIVLLFAAVPLVLDVYGTGLHTVFYASTYLERTGPAVAFKVGRALGAIGLFLSGYVFFSQRSLRLRISAAALALGYAALYLGTDTRFFALVVPMFCFGGLLTGTWSHRQRVVAVVISGVAALLMIQIPLVLRSEPSHGLVAALTYLRHDPSLIVASPLNNVLLGAPLTLYVAHNVPALGWHELATSLSPLPSSMTDWSQIGPTLQLNPTTPYSALGELLNHGWWCLCLVMTGFGALYAVLERLVRRSIAPGLGVLILSAVAALSVLRSTEYDLRTFARLGYYAAVIVVLLLLVPQHRTRRSRSTALPPIVAPPTGT